MKQPTVYLISGRTGAGKTTIARQLAAEKRAFRISHDEWLLAAYDRTTGIPFREKCGRINDLIWKQVQILNDLGLDVVLEGWGSRKLRDQARIRLGQMGAAYEFFYVECPQQERWRRVAKRNSSTTYTTHEGEPISLDDFIRMEEIAEEFGEDEPVTIIDNSARVDRAPIPMPITSRQITTDEQPGA